MRAAEAEGPADAAVQRIVYLDILLVMLTLGVIAPSLNDIRGDFGVSYSAVSWAISVFAIGRLIGNVPASRLAGSIPLRRTELLLGTALVGIGTLVGAVSPTLWGLLVGRAVAGVGSAAVATAGMLVVLELAPEGERGRASGRYSAYLGAGALMGPALGGILAPVAGWRGALGLSGGVLLAFTALLASTVRKGLLTPDGSELIEGSPPQDEPHGVWSPLACIAYGVAFAVFWTRGSIQQAIVPLLGGEQLHMSPFDVSVVLFLCSGVATVGSSLVGRRLDVKGWHTTIPALLALMVGGSLIVAGAGSRTTLTLGALTVAVGLSSGGAPASIVVDAVPASDRARAVGWLRTIGDVALLGAPATTGWLADRSGFGPGAAIAAVVAVIVLIAVLAFLLRSSGAARSIRKLEVLWGHPQERN